MALMRVSLTGALGALLVATVACENNRSITTDPVGNLGFGTVFTKTASNLPRGTATFPASPVASATPANDSVIVTLAGLDSLTSGTYTVWFGNDSATKWVQAASINVRVTKIDSTTDANGDPVFTTTVTNQNGVAGFKNGGPNKTVRVATSRAAASGMAAGDSLNVVLVSVEPGAAGGSPGEARPLWGRRSQATSNVAGLRFGTFGRGIPASGQAGNPGPNQEFVLATSTTAGVASMTIVPRGRVEVRGKILVANDSNYFRPPAGYYYNAYAIKLDTTNVPSDTAYLGRRTSPYPMRTSLFEADVDNPSPDVVFDSPKVIFAMATRVSADTLAEANSSPAWKDFGFVRVNLQSKYSAEGVMGPVTILEATLPKSVRGR